jgi:hypothetical protein
MIEIKEPTYIVTGQKNILRAVKSFDLSLAAWHFWHNTRKAIINSWGFDDMTSEEAIDLVYRAFREELEVRDINLEELV